MSSSNVERQESMRWASPHHNYDGGDWEEDGLDEIAEEDDEIASIKSEELQVEEHNEDPSDYRNIYEYYEDEDDLKRQSYNQQLEDEIYQQLTPGHSRSTSADSHVDPELAALYEGTSEFLSRPISVYAEGQIKPLVLHTSDSDKRIGEILGEESTPQQTPVAEKLPDVYESEEPADPAGKSATGHATGQAQHINPYSTRKVEKPLEEPVEKAPEAPEPTDEAPKAPGSPAQPVTEFTTPLHSPSLAAVAVSPSDLPTTPGKVSPPTSPHSSDNSINESHVYGVGSESAQSSTASFVPAPSFVAPDATSPATQTTTTGAPALALTCATPEGSDNEEDVREKPDWQPRWAPEVKREPEPEPVRADLYESQISLDMSDQSSLQSRASSAVSKPRSPHVKGFVDVAEGDSDGAETDLETDTETIEEKDMLDVDSKSQNDESVRSTIASLDSDHNGDRSAGDGEDIPPIPAVPEVPETRGPDESAAKGIAARVTRPPVIDLKSVFGLDTSAKRLKALWDLRVRESEYTTQLNTWLEATHEKFDDKGMIYPNGQPPASESHSLPVARQVNVTLSHSGVKTKETFQKVGKGLNAMKKLMRSKEQ